MIIAETLVKHGMTTGEAFNSQLQDIIRSRGVSRVLETGTYLGTGTTLAVAEVLQHTPNAEVYTIEVNPEYCKQARRNLRLYPFVNVVNGLSIPRHRLPSSITFDVPDQVIVDHQPEAREKNYRREVMFNVPDDMLGKILKGFTPDLIILDSAGHIGLQEFRHLLSVSRPPYILALDDTGHVKHYQSLQYILQYPAKFNILWQTDEKFGSAIIQVL